jgi:hypothetical protein
MCGHGVCLGQHDTHQVNNRDFWNFQARLTTDDILQEGIVLAPVDRAVLWGRLAAIWWQFDRERAGTWLNEAIDVVDSGPDGESDSDRRKRLSSLRVLLGIAAPLDGRSSNRLAALLSSTELKPSNEEVGQNSNALVQAALNVVQSDPPRAAALGAASLRVGKSLSFPSLLVRLRAQNQKLGDALFTEALAAASARSDTDLLGGLTIMAFNTSPPSSELRKYSVIAVSRQFLGSDQNASPNRGCSLAPAVVPLLEHFDKAEPQAAIIIRNALIRCRKVQSSRSAMGADKASDDLPLKTVDNLIEAASKASNIDEKVVYLSRAAYLAAQEKNFIRSLSILDAFTEEERKHLGSVWDNWRWDFASSAAIAYLRQADRYGMDKIITTTPSHLRPFVQLSVAEELANSGDAAGAIELLEASRKAFKSDARDLFDWYLSLLRRFAKLAPSESPAVFREFVTSINRFGQPDNTEDATAYDSYVPVELPAALVEPDVVGILQATSQIKPYSIRVRTRLGFLKTFLQLGRK